MNSPASDGPRPKADAKTWGLPGYLHSSKLPLGEASKQHVAAMMAAEELTAKEPPRLYGYKAVETDRRTLGDVPNGYAFAKDQLLSYEDMVKLILPVTLLDTMSAERDAHDAAQQALADSFLSQKTGSGEKSTSHPGAESDAAGVGDSGVCDEEEPLGHKLAHPLKAPYQDRISKPVELLDSKEIDSFAAHIQTRPKAERPRLEDILKQLKLMGNWRHLLYPLCQGQQLAPTFACERAGAEVDVALRETGGVKEGRDDQDAQVDGDLRKRALSVQRAFIRAQFDELLEQFPHFAPVIDIYRTYALAAAATAAVMSPPPVLMMGIPGVGKTHFAQALAECMGLPMVKLAFDAGLTNSVLLGSDQHWGNTHHGQLFEHLCLRQVANPLLLLDELDKAAVHHGGSSQSALTALHSCLEPSTSPKVRDISVGVTMNASHVIWLATANHGHLIPDSIRSRFTEVTISPPVDPQALIQLNWHVCQSVVGPLGLQMPSSSIRTSLAVLSPREQRKHLQAACQHALGQDRDWLKEDDFSPGVVGDVPGLIGGKRQRKGPSSVTQLLH